MVLGHGEGPNVYPYWFGWIVRVGVFHADMLLTPVLNRHPLSLSQAGLQSEAPLPHHI